MPALALRGTPKFGFGDLLQSGALQFITSATGSAATSISINNCFSASYSHYLVMRNLSGSVSGAGLNVRLRASGVDDSAANYRYQYINANSTVVSSGRAAAQTVFLGCGGYAESSAMGFSRLWISNPFEAVRTTIWSDASSIATGLIQLETYVQEHDLASSYDGLSLIPASGTVTGSIFLYGLVV